jgi:hypothetical protein
MKPGRLLVLQVGVALATLVLTPLGARAQTGTMSSEVAVDFSSRLADGRFAPLTTDGIRQAIELASDEEAAHRFLKSYVIWFRAGWGDGPLIGSFSTPFSRVVRGALNARAAGRTISVEDVPAAWIAPEVQVIAMSQAATDADRSHVQRVVFVGRQPAGDEVVIEPIKMVPFTQRYRDPGVGAVTNAAVIAVFPLEALANVTAVRVQFDHVARGSNAMSTCQSCLVPIQIAAIR